MPTQEPLEKALSFCTFREAYQDQRRWRGIEYLRELLGLQEYLLPFATHQDNGITMQLRDEHFETPYSIARHYLMLLHRQSQTYRYGDHCFQEVFRLLDVFQAYSPIPWPDRHPYESDCHQRGSSSICNTHHGPNVVHIQPIRKGH